MGTPSGRAPSGGELTVKGSLGDRFLRTRQLGVDLLERRSLAVAGDLALGRIGGRDRQVRSGADLLGGRQHPFDQALEVGSRWAHLAGREVDQLAAQAVPDRAPEVLLD